MNTWDVNTGDGRGVRVDAERYAEADDKLYFFTGSTCVAFFRDWRYVRLRERPEAQQRGMS